MANLSNINGKFVVDTAGNIGVGTLTPRSDANTTNISIQSSGTARLFVNNTGASGKEYAIYSSANGDFGIFDYGAVSARLVINSAGNATFAGNVGIGAAASDGNLHVRKTGVNTGITNVLMNANFADGSNGTGLSIGYRTDETTAVIAARTATGNIAFYSYDGGWSESMRIKNNGNVGIGVSSPVGKLQVSLPTYTNEDTNSQQAIFGVDSGYGVRIGYNETDNKGYINVLKPGVAWGSLILQEDVGKVGIGTTLPDYILTTQGSGVQRLKVIATDPSQHSAGVYFLVKNGASQVGTGTIATQNNGDMDFYTGSTSEAFRMTILAGGNVGIGTTSPGSTLTLGNATGNVAELRVLRSNSLSTTYGFINTVGGTAQLGGSSDTRIIASTGRLLFNSNTRDQISLEANGEYRLKLGSNTTGYEASMDNTDTAYRIFGSRFGGTGKYVAIWSDGANENTRFYPTKTVFYRDIGIGTAGPVNKLGIQVAGQSNTKAINIYSLNTSPNSYTSIGSQYSISNTYVESEIRFGNETQNGGGSYLGFVAGGSNLGNTEKMRITSAGGISFGSTGTAYGAAGEVLTSNGNASPSWQAAGGGGSAWPQEKFAVYTINSTTSNILIATMNSTTWHGDYQGGCLKFTINDTNYIQVSYVTVYTYLSGTNKWFFKGNTEMTEHNLGTNPFRYVFAFTGAYGAFGPTTTLKINRVSNGGLGPVNVLVQAISSPDMFILN